MATNRFFIGNSFALNLGLGYRQIEASGSAFSLYTADKVTFNFVAQTILLQSGIANYWTLDSGVFIGVNWIGYAFAASSGYTWDANSSGAFSNNSEQFAQILDSGVKRLSNLSTVTSSASIGYQF